jgi:perosamine synthetase
MRYSIAAPCVGQEEAAALIEAIREGEVSRGKSVRGFEDSFANLLRGGQAVSVVTGTSAIEVAIRALNLQGSEVITGAMSCQATANALLAAGCKIRFADHDPRTWQVSITEIERLVTTDTKAIVVAHLYGNTADLDGLVSIAGANGIALIEDCSQSLGAMWNLQPAGTFGNASTFSFYSNKLITTGEGGMVWTANAEIADRARTIRDYGQEGHFHHTTYGLNWKMPNLLAAMGVQQLKRVPELLAARRERMQFLQKAFSSEPCLALPELPSQLNPAPFCFPIVVNGHEAAPIRERLAEQGIETRPLFRSQFDQPYWSSFAPMPDGDFAVARKLFQHGLYLSVSPHLSIADFEQITEIVLKTISAPEAVEQIAS